MNQAPYIYRKVQTFADRLTRDISNSAIHYTEMTNCVEHDASMSRTQPTEDQALAAMTTYHRKVKRHLIDDQVNGFILTGYRTLAVSGTPRYTVWITVVDHQGRDHLVKKEIQGVYDMSGLIAHLDGMRLEIRKAHDNQCISFSF